MARRIRWIKKEKVESGYTIVYLTRAGKKALRNLTTDEHYLIANELTAGGGYDAEHGILYFVHTSVPVSTRWSKVRAILKRAYRSSSGENLYTAPNRSVRRISNRRSKSNTAALGNFTNPSLSRIRNSKLMLGSILQKARRKRIAYLQQPLHLIFNESFMTGCCLVFK